MNTTKKQGTRESWLDFLRVIAVFLVMWAHLVNFTFNRVVLLFVSLIVVDLFPLIVHQLIEKPGIIFGRQLGRSKGTR